MNWKDELSPGKKAERFAFECCFMLINQTSEGRFNLKGISGVVSWVGRKQTEAVKGLMLNWGSPCHTNAAVVWIFAMSLSNEYSLNSASCQCILPFLWKAHTGQSTPSHLLKLLLLSTVPYLIIVLTDKRSLQLGITRVSNKERAIECGMKNLPFDPNAHKTKSDPAYKIIQTPPYPHHLPPTPHSSQDIK